MSCGVSCMLVSCRVVVDVGWVGWKSVSHGGGGDDLDDLRLVDLGRLGGVLDVVSLLGALCLEIWLGPYCSPSVFAAVLCWSFAALCTLAASVSKTVLLLDWSKSCLPLVTSS